MPTKIMAAYLDEYATPMPGQFCPSARFRKNFVRWVDRKHGPECSLWFAQKLRAFRVLQDVSGAPIGLWQPNKAITFGIGNLQLPGSYQVCERKLALEADAPGLAEQWLMPTDFRND